MHYIHLDTLGIINGCIDELYQSFAYAEMAYNNTYGIQAINQSTYEHLVHVWEKKDGIQDKIIKCRHLAAISDPDEHGDVSKVNLACRAASEETEELRRAYFETNVSAITACSRTVADTPT